MTLKEFQEKYHSYSTKNFEEALIESLRLRVYQENGERIYIVPVTLGENICLMTENAAAMVSWLI